MEKYKEKAQNTDKETNNLHLQESHKKHKTRRHDIFSKDL